MSLADLRNSHDRVFNNRGVIDGEYLMAMLDDMVERETLSYEDRRALKDLILDLFAERGHG